MKSFTSRKFRDRYARLPEPVRARAQKAYRLFTQDPSHSGLQFKKVEGQTAIYSAGIGLGYRALGQLDADGIVWFWIWPHTEY